VNDINEIIRQASNPFASQLTPGNFWQEEQDTAQTLNSIHQDILTKVKTKISQINRSRSRSTLLISGDSGSGKSYLLGRIKRHLNQKAFFAYISPWPDSDYIWRHTLRQTVDSLTCIPEGKKDSQLILWIKSLSAFKKRDFGTWILGERRSFTHKLNATYPSGIYNAHYFFGVLYDLTNPKLYSLACNWLRGDDLDESELDRLNVPSSIDSEDAARAILTNFGKIAADTQPIVLCFDQLDNIPRKNNDYLDFQSLMNINSTIHNECFHKFLVIISVITHTWQKNKSQIQPADLARIDSTLKLGKINLEQAEALWAMRLHSLHSRADKQPESNIYPLTSEQLKSTYPGGKTLPRNALVLGCQLFESYQIDPAGKSPTGGGETETIAPPIGKLSAFKLIWQEKYQQVQQEVKTNSQLSEPELIKMLQEVLEAYEITDIKPQLLSGKYSVNSFSWRSPENHNLGIVWTENPNMNGFCYAMKACEKVVKDNICQNLYLIRAAGVGNSKLKGYKVYQQIFGHGISQHLQPNLSDIHYLATYHRLVNAALGEELLILDQVIDLSELRSLVRMSAIMSQCSLLEQLKIVTKSRSHKPADDLAAIKKFLITKMNDQQMIARPALSQLTLARCQGNVNQSNVDLALEKLIAEHKIKLMNSNADTQAQIICLVPH